MKTVNFGRRYCEAEMDSVVTAAKAYVEAVAELDNSTGVEELLVWGATVDVQHALLKRAVTDLARAEQKIAGSPRPRESEETTGPDLSVVSNLAAPRLLEHGAGRSAASGDIAS